MTSELKKLLLLACRLFIHTYFYVFPILLVYALLQFVTDKFIPVQKNVINLQFLLNSFIQLIIYIFFFCLTIHAIFLKSKQQTFSYVQVMIQGAMRFTQMLTGYLIGTFITVFVVVGSSLAIVFPTVLPLVFVSQKQAMLFEMLKDLVFGFVIDLFQGFQLGFLGVFSFSPMYLMNLVHNITTSKIGIVELIIISICLAIVLYYFVMGNLIVNREFKAWNAFMQSIRLVKGNWLLTLGLVAVWASIIVMLDLFLDYLATAYTKQILSILTFSLSPAIMVIYCDYLEKMPTANK